MSRCQCFPNMCNIILLNINIHWFVRCHLFCYVERYQCECFVNNSSGSMMWFDIRYFDQRIHYTILSITYKTLQSRKPSYLHNLLRIQSDTCTRSSTTVTLKRPTISSRLKITDRSFTHYAPVLWNAPPKAFRQPLIHSSHAIQFGSTSPLLDLSTSQICNSILKLIYSTNHFLLSLFHTLTSFLWLSWPDFRFSIAHSFSLFHPQPFHSLALRPTKCT